MHTPAKMSFSTLALSFALVPILVDAQTPVCEFPGCNSVASDEYGNTGIGSGALDAIAHNCNPLNDPFCFPVNNTAAGSNALGSINGLNMLGNGNSAFGTNALGNNVGGNSNTAVGASALQANVGSMLNGPAVGGNENTAIGLAALTSNTYGSDNAAVGINALSGNTTGNTNVAVGTSALGSNTTASNNTAVGNKALSETTTAGDNAAFGAGSLQFNVTGTENAAFGANALFANTTGSYNTAAGVQALFANTTASGNTASGYRALYSSTVGQDNAAFGFGALIATTLGGQNTAIGSNALHANTTGMNNVALGASAGYSITGSNNIDIGAAGSAGESGVIRIGGASQSAVYVAGITNTHLAGAPVYVDSKGQLGLLASAARYKTGVTPLGDLSEKVQLLRPVSYHLKDDPSGNLQYGLIAEEVAKVLPALVIRDETGDIQGVRYDELTPMLIDEVKREQREIKGLKQQMMQLQAMATEAMRRRSP